jgi:hypothetical protein
MLQDLKNGIFSIPSITPGSKVAAVYNGTAISMEKYLAVVFTFQTGAIAGTATPKIQESADNVTWTDVETERLNPATALVNLTANSIMQVGITDINKLTKNWLRPVVTVAGGAADLAVSAVMGHAVNEPAGEAGASSIYIN